MKGTSPLDTTEIRLVSAGFIGNPYAARNLELPRRFEKLRKARASHDLNGIKRTETEYFQSLQHLYTAVQDAVAGFKP